MILNHYFWNDSLPATQTKSQFRTKHFFKIHAHLGIVQIHHYQPHVCGNIYMYRELNAVPPKRLIRVFVSPIIQGTGASKCSVKWRWLGKDIKHKGWAFRYGSPRMLLDFFSIGGWLGIFKRAHQESSCVRMTEQAWPAAFFCYCWDVRLFTYRFWYHTYTRMQLTRLASRYQSCCSLTLSSLGKPWSFEQRDFQLSQ